MHERLAQRGVAGDALGMEVELDRRAGIGARETHEPLHRHPEAEQAAAHESSADALEAAFAGGAGNEAEHAGDHSRHPRVLRIAHLHPDRTALGDRVRVEQGKRLRGEQVRAGHGRARMAGELDRIGVGVLDQPFAHGAEELGKRVAQPNARCAFEEVGRVHDALTVFCDGGSVLREAGGRLNFDQVLLWPRRAQRARRTSSNA